MMPSNSMNNIVHGHSMNAMHNGAPMPPGMNSGSYQSGNTMMSGHRNHLSHLLSQPTSFHSPKQTHSQMQLPPGMQSRMIQPIETENYSVPQHQLNMSRSSSMPIHSLSNPELNQPILNNDSAVVNGMNSYDVSHHPNQASGNQMMTSHIQQTYQCHDQPHIQMQPTNQSVQDQQHITQNQSAIVHHSQQQLKQFTPQKIPDQPQTAHNSLPQTSSMQLQHQQPQTQFNSNPSNISPNALQDKPAESSNTDKQKLIQQQLRLLLHAMKCQKQEQEPSNCPPHCRTMRSVLTHMEHCTQGKNCQTAHCASSRQIISHFKACVSASCPVCSPVKRRVIRNVQPMQQNQKVQPQQDSTFTQLDPTQPPPMSNGSISSVQSDTSCSDQHSMLSQPVSQSTFANQMQPIQSSPAQFQEPVIQVNGYNQLCSAPSWKQNISESQRQMLVRKIVHAIFPADDKQAYMDPRMANLIEYAKKVELEMFQQAKDTEHYYKMLADKCNKIHKELSEKRRLRNAGNDINGSCNRSINGPSTNFTNTTVPISSDSANSSNSISNFDIADSSSLTFSRNLSTSEANNVADNQSISSSHMSTSTSTSITNQIDTSVSQTLSSPSLTLKTEPSIPSSSDPCSFNSSSTTMSDSKSDVKVSQSPAASKSVPTYEPSSNDNTPKDAVKDEIKEEPVGTPVSASSHQHPQTPSSATTSTDKIIKTESEPKDRKNWTREELLRHFLPLHKEICEEKDAAVFLEPVDAIALNIPDYYKVIKYPMDLSTIKNKLQDGAYSTPWNVVDDFWLMFNNAWTYNKRTSRVYKMTSKVAEVFESKIDPLMQSLGFCCGREYYYLPQVLYCSSPNLCAINKEATYYQFENKQHLPKLECERYLLCEKCFNDSNTEAPVTDDPAQPPVMLKKSLFEKKKNNVKEHEIFYKCTECGRRWHQVCACHFEEIWPEGFVCRTCIREKSLKRKENRFTAKRLPTTKLSAYLEKRINDFLKKKDVNTGEVTIRVLCSCDKKVDVKTGMRARFAESGEMAESFPYRMKAIFAYQDIDGHDVCFFGLHVQEYGSDCAQPNQRRVYISYLDSVFFFRPKQYRTDVYHEILGGYLAYVKHLGYTMAHIWACPPGEGDDYIFHMHPPEQKIPKPKRLQEWYQKILEKSLSEGTVVDFRDILRDAVETNMVSPTEIPYFEGDFWPNAFEEIFRELEAEEKKRKQEEAQARQEEEEIASDHDENGDAGKKASGKKKAKKRKGNGRTGGNSKRKKATGPLDNGDDLSRRVYETMEKNKDMFFVIHLHTTAAAAELPKITDPDPLISSELMDGRDAFLQMARDRHLEFSSLRRAMFSTMVMLFEIHKENRGEFYHCNLCNKSIETRYHCKTCDEFDMCFRCYENNTHVHPLVKITSEFDDGESSPDNGENNWQESRRSSLERFVKVLAHSSQCRDMNCRMQNCFKMKQWTQHFKNCKKRNNKQCPVCQRFLCLLFYHAKGCNNARCDIPLCRKMKDNMRQQQLRQQQAALHMMRRRMATMQDQANPSTPVSSNSNNSVLSPQRPQPSLPAQNNIPTSQVNHPSSSCSMPITPSKPMMSPGIAPSSNQMPLKRQNSYQMSGMETPNMTPNVVHSSMQPMHYNNQFVKPNTMMQQQQPPQQVPQDQPGMQSWRISSGAGVPMTSAPTPQHMTQQSDIVTVQQVLGNIRSRFPDAQEQTKQIREWLQSNQQYYHAYQIISRAQQHQRMSQQHQPPTSAPPMMSQQPQLRGMLMSNNAGPCMSSQQPSQPIQHQWMMQQQQQQSVRYRSQAMAPHPTMIPQQNSMPPQTMVPNQPNAGYPSSAPPGSQVPRATIMQQMQQPHSRGPQHPGIPSGAALPPGYSARPPGVQPQHGIPAGMQPAPPSQQQMSGYQAPPDVVVDPNIRPDQRMGPQF